MAPSATSVTPPHEVGGTQTAELTAAAVAKKIAQATPISNGVEHLNPLDASKLRFTRTSTPMSVPEPGDPIIATASQCTDHMITAVWKAGTGWEAPELRPYANLSLAPTASVLHYATECFEGMKMYRGYDGKLRLFRPDANCRRMVRNLFIYPTRQQLTSPAHISDTDRAPCVRPPRTREIDHGHRLRRRREMAPGVTARLTPLSTTNNDRQRRGIRRSNT